MVEHSKDNNLRCSDVENCVPLQAFQVGTTTYIKSIAKYVLKRYIKR